MTEAGNSTEAGARTTTRPVSERVSAAVPPGWTWKDSMTLVDASGDANVIFSSEPLQSGTSSRDYADTQGKLLFGDFPGFRQIRFEEIEVFGGREGFMRRFEWQPEGSPRVAQIQLYYVEGDRGYTATATTTLDDFQQYNASLVKILDGLRIGGDGDGVDPETETDPIVVLNDNRAETRYEAWVDGELAGEVPYQLRCDVIALLPIALDRRFEGRDISGRLAATALDGARAEGLRVLPFCDFVVSYIKVHPEYADLVPAEQRAAFEL